MRDQQPISVTALYVLGKLEEHTRECAKRWSTLTKLVIAGFGSLTLALIILIVTLLSHGAK